MNKVTHKYDRLLLRWIAAVENNAALVLIMAVVLTAVAISYSVRNLSINTEMIDMIDARQQWRQTYDRYAGLFPQFDETVVVVITGHTPEIAEDAARRLTGRLRADDELFTSVFAPDLHPFFERNGLLYLSLEELNDLSDRLAEVQPLLAKLNADPSLRGLFDILGEAVDETVSSGEAQPGLADAIGQLSPTFESTVEGAPVPLSWQTLIRPPGDDEPAMRRLVIVQPRLDYTQLRPAAAAVGAIRAITGDLQGSLAGDVDIRLTGPAALKAEELDSVAQGTGFAGLLSLILVGLIATYGMRSARLVLSVLMTLIIGLIWTATFAFATIGYLNLISVAFAVLFIGLGVDFGVHLVLRYREEIAYRGPDHAMQRAGGGVGRAMCICAPTTALAFYAFTPTAYVGLSQLGIIAGTGMFIALIASLVIIPAFHRIWPLKHVKLHTISFRPTAVLNLQYYDRYLVLLALALGVAAAIALPNARFDFDPMKLRDPDSESVSTMYELMADDTASPYTIQVLADDAAEAAHLRVRLAALPEVEQMVSLEDFVPANQEEKLGILDVTALFLMPAIEASFPVPAPSREEESAAIGEFRDRLRLLFDFRADTRLAGEARRLHGVLGSVQHAAVDNPDIIDQAREAVFHYFPRQMDRLALSLNARPVTLSDLPDPILERYIAPDGTRRIEVFGTADMRERENLIAFTQAVDSIAHTATGGPYQITGAGRAVRSAMKHALLYAAVMIVSLLFIVFRRVRSVVLILVPITLTGLFTVAATVIFDIPFNFANVIVLPLIIGLGVDAGIHFVMREDEEGSEAQVLASSTPRAVLLSALTTIGSFGSLAISQHRGTASMGILLTISLVLLLFNTLLTLPALMSWLNRWRMSKTPAE